MNILIWLVSGVFYPVAVFLLAGYVTSFFSKNMIVILVIAFVVSNVVNTGTQIAIEGMENKATQDKIKGLSEKQDKKKKDGKKKDGFQAKEGVDEESEGVDGDETHEGVDDETHEGVDDEPCTADSDCKNGQMCDTSNFICVAK